MTRKDVICGHLDIDRGIGLEFGPLNRPLVARADGDVRYVDVRTTEDLRKTIPASAGYKPEDFVEIDYVWCGGSLRDAIGSDTMFDYAIASHVIEHTPNAIGWLNDIASALKPGGLISLAIPDCRYIFDILRAPTTAATVVADFLRAETQPRAHHVFDALAHAVRVPDGDDYWRFLRGEIDPLTLSRVHTPEQALEMARRAEQPGVYVDCHTYTFNPESFAQIIETTRKLGLHELTIVRHHYPAEPNHEFFVTLGRQAPER